MTASKKYNSINQSLFLQKLKNLPVNDDLPVTREYDGGGLLGAEAKDALHGRVQPAIRTVQQCARSTNRNASVYLFNQ